MTKAAMALVCLVIASAPAMAESDCRAADLTGVEVVTRDGIGVVASCEPLRVRYKDETVKIVSEVIPVEFPIPPDMPEWAAIQIDPNWPQTRHEIIDKAN